MKSNYIKTQIVVIPTEEGESIEEMLRRLTANKEPVPQDVPPMYTPMKDGVIAETDIRHDRFDTAYEATDKFAGSDTARSAEIADPKFEPQEPENKEGGE